MGKGSKKTETEVSLPPAIERASKENLKIANEVAAMGYVPYQGPTQAGLTPQHLAGMSGLNSAAQAFGMPAAQTNPAMSQEQLLTALTGMPPPNAQYGGFSGYSSHPIFQQAQQNIGPAHKAMIESFIMDPNTGAPPTNPAVPELEFRYGVHPELARNQKPDRFAGMRDFGMMRRGEGDAGGGHRQPTIFDMLDRRGR